METAALAMPNGLSSTMSRSMHHAGSPCNLVFVHLVVGANLFVRRQPGVRQSNQRRIGHEVPHWFIPLVLGVKIAATEVAAIQAA